MAFFLREKKDGKRTIGYGVYLIAGLLAIGAIVYLHGLLVGASGPQHGRLSLPSDVNAITSAAALTNSVNVKTQAKKDGIDPSHRLDRNDRPRPAAPSPATPADDSLDTINLALKKAALGPTAEEGAATQANDGGGQAGSSGAAASTFPELPPAFPTEAEPRKEPASSQRVQLFDYRDETADIPALPATIRSAQTPASSAPDIVPRGTLICVFLLTTVDTGNPSATIEFGAAKTLVFNHRFQLGFGTRFLGKLSGKPNRDRVNLTVDTILYPDGRELPISATAVEADDTGSNIRPGVEAYYFPPPAWAQISPYIADFITGYMSLLQSRAEQGLTANIGGVSLQTSATADPRSPLYQSSAQAVQAFTQARLADIEQRYATYYLIPAGSACWLQLDRDLDLKSKPAASPATISAVLAPAKPAAATKGEAK
jgi:hypothetical protein